MQADVTRDTRDGITLAPYARIYIAPELIVQMLSSRAATPHSFTSTMPEGARIVRAQMIRHGAQGWVIEVTVTAPGLPLADPRDPPVIEPVITMHSPSSPQFDGPAWLREAWEALDAE